MAYASYGLPRYVIAILHIMETHKDCLKWTVSERSHKLSLTLTWDFKFKENKSKKTFWTKLQNTLKGGGSGGQGGGRFLGKQEEPSEVPRNLIRFIKRLELETKEDQIENPRNSFNQNYPHKMTPQNQQMLRRQQRWSRYSLQSLPNRYQSNSQGYLTRANENLGVGSPSQQRVQPPLQNPRLNPRLVGMKSYSSYHHLPIKESISPFHNSWPEDSFEASSDPVEDKNQEVVLASGGPSQPRLYPSNQILRNINPTKQSNFKKEFKSQRILSQSHSNEKMILDEDSEFNESVRRMPTKRIPQKYPINRQMKNNSGGKRDLGGFGRPIQDHRRSASASSNHSNPSIKMNNLNQKRKTPIGTNFLKTPSDLNFRLKSFPTTKQPISGKIMNSEVTGVTSESDSTSDMLSEEEEEEEESQRKQTVNQTVIRCLDSCDKILYRHSTTIT